MTPEQHAALPEAIRVRELRYRITRRGFRTRQVVLVTTLLDAHAYPAPTRWPSCTADDGTWRRIWRT